MDVRGAKKEMNDLYQKINKYVYEIRMIEFDEYFNGMNRKKMDTEKAFEIIIAAPDSKSNPISSGVVLCFRSFFYRQEQICI